MQFCGCLVCENLCKIFEQVQFCSAGTPLLTMLHQDYLLPVPSNRPFTQAEATSLQCLCHIDVICTWPHFNPRKKYVKTSFYDITASKRDVRRHIHPKRLLKHFFGPICLLDMSFRTPVRKYREFRDSTKNSNFFLFFQKVPFDELFSKKICKRSSTFYFFFAKWRKFENATRSTQIADGRLMEIMQNRAFSIFIFSRTETFLRFIIGQVVIRL